MDKRIEKIAGWIKNEVAASGCKGVVVGLSGGIDSALAAALSKKAVGKNVLGLFMPCHSHKDDLKEAKAFAKKFKIKTKLVDLSKIYDALTKLFPKGNKLAKANLKPRLRMISLYYYANSLNYLVIGTGNKSEAMVGYFTKYGDGGVDLLPLADLFKTDVRDLARELDIPKSIINRPPTAGLWAGQTDESEMGITYPELDKILCRIVMGDSPGDKKGKKVMCMLRSSAHKRSGPKSCML